MKWYKISQTPGECQVQVYSDDFWVSPDEKEEQGEQRGAEEQGEGAETKLLSDWSYKMEYRSIYTEMELGMSIYGDK